MNYILHLALTLAVAVKRKQKDEFFFLPEKKEDKENNKKAWSRLHFTLTSPNL